MVRPNEMGKRTKENEPRKKVAWYIGSAFVYGNGLCPCDI